MFVGVYIARVGYIIGIRDGVRPRSDYHKNGSFSECHSYEFGYEVPFSVYNPHIDTAILQGQTINNNRSKQ